MKKQGKVWGTSYPIFSKNNVEVHAIHVMSGGYCSKHYHKSKFNTFIVVKGKLKVTIWKPHEDGVILEDITYLEEGSECTVEPGINHRFEALMETYALEIYHVELDVNDIVRETHGGCDD